jgi:hypothetical protein
MAYEMIPATAPAIGLQSAAQCLQAAFYHIEANSLFLDGMISLCADLQRGFFKTEHGVVSALGFERGLELAKLAYRVSAHP